MISWSSRIEYGEAQPDRRGAQPARRACSGTSTQPASHQCRGSNANDATMEAYDFKGNLLRSTRRLASDYHASPTGARIPSSTTRPSRSLHPLRRAQPADPVGRRRTATSLGPRATSSSRCSTRPILLQRVDVWLVATPSPTDCSTVGGTPRRRSASTTSTSTPRASASASTTRTAPARSTTTTRSPSG